ncbi:MAG: LysR family transcriptional regulator [Alphaproteobacteria bacterium]|nr:LysR family transcriptional regulator [Alphaproteobacteria bacterium]
MNVDIRHLRAFLAVAETGAFRRAAERLRMSQPALSAQIRDLERAVGVVLFDRTTRRVEMTAAGREFLPQAAKLLGDLESALRGLTDLAQHRRGHVAVACAPLLASVMLPRLMAMFIAAHPGIRISLIDARTDQIVDKVRSGEADLGIGTFADAEPDIARTRLFRDSLFVFAPIRPNAPRRPATWAEIADEPLIALTRESGLRALVEMGFGTLGRPARPAYEVAQVTTAVSLVEAGLGIAVLPAVAKAIARDRRVTLRALAQPRVTREVSLIVASARTPTPAAQAFAALARETAAAFGERA